MNNEYLLNTSLAAAFDVVAARTRLTELQAARDSAAHAYGMALCAQGGDAALEEVRRLRSIGAACRKSLEAERNQARLTMVLDIYIREVLELKDERPNEILGLFGIECPPPHPTTAVQEKYSSAFDTPAQFDEVPQAGDSLQELKWLRDTAQERAALLAKRIIAEEARLDSLRDEIVGGLCRFYLSKKGKADVLRDLFIYHAVDVLCLSAESSYNYLHRLGISYHLAPPPNALQVKQREREEKVGQTPAPFPNEAQRQERHDNYVAAGAELLEILEGVIIPE